jgi:hypothetical protein
MSEELPLHRNIDLTIFICEVMDMLKNGQSGRSITIQNQTSEIRKIVENEFVDEHMELLKVKLFNGEQGEFMNDRLVKLAAVLKRIGY